MINRKKIQNIPLPLLKKGMCLFINSCRQGPGPSGGVTTVIVTVLPTSQFEHFTYNESYSDLHLKRTSFVSQKVHHLSPPPAKKKVTWAHKSIGTRLSSVLSSVMVVLNWKQIRKVPEEIPSSADLPGSVPILQLSTFFLCVLYTKLILK